MRGNEIESGQFPVARLTTFTIPMRGNEPNQLTIHIVGMRVYDPHEG